METLIILSYIALCVIVFRVFKVPKNKWTLTTACVIGMFLVGWIFMYMAMYQPVARVAGIYSITTPITSEVSGIVKKVHIEGNAPLEQGQPLYDIDPVPFQAEVDKANAQIASVEAKIVQLTLSKANINQLIIKTNASLEFNKKELARFSKLAQKDFSAKQKVDKLTDTVIELQAVQNQNKIQLEVVDSQITEQDANQSLYEAGLAKAQFNLESTVVRAPTDGYVTQVALRPGMKSRVIPFQGNLTFVHKEDKVIFAAFKQNPARYIKEGYPAEVTFKTIPGHAYEATVMSVLDITKEGAVSASGVLNDPLARLGGRILVRIEINEPDLLKGMPLPAGTDAHVAVYSPEWEIFSIVRKVILRMQSWQNWLFEG